MSTYNGGRYLREQLDSIFLQQGVKINLVIRDDGSTDNTIEIINSYEGIHLITGENIGCEASFMELLYMPIESDYYAFADQDDVWYPDKLISAIKNMRDNNCDLSVCNLELVDGNLHSNGNLFTYEELEFQRNRMKRFAVCNLHGCVQVWSRRLHDIMQSYRPATIIPHDVWVNAVANIVSSTYIDVKPHIKYRLHGDNTSGYATNEIERIKKGIRLYLGKKHPHYDLLSTYLIEGFGDYLDKESEKYVALILVSNYKKSFLARVKLFFHEFITDTTFQYRTLYRIMILTNRY